MGVEVQGGITIGPGIIIGDVFAVPAFFVTEVTAQIFVTEDGFQLVTEIY
jgi:hypothetical protein